MAACRPHTSGVGVWPLLVRWPAWIRPGNRTAETVCLVGLMATCAEMLAVELPDGAAEDSGSYLPL